MVLTRDQIAEYEEIIIKAFQKESFMAGITKSIATVIQSQFAIVIKKYEESIAKMTEEIATLRLENEVLKKECNSKTDVLEQYSRKNNLRVYGIQETQNENVEALVNGLLKNNLGLSMGENYIDCCHRVGPKRDNRPRPILVRFVSYKSRAEVYRSKSKLKGSKLLIKEDLTQLRVTHMKKLISKYGHRNVWTFNGDIFYNDDTSKKKFVL